MSAEVVIKTENLGKMYKLFESRKAKIMDVLGLAKIFFWTKKSYKEFWALRDVSLEIKRGERVGIIGHNGAGKSTLLKTLIGNHEITEGSMFINGNIQALMTLGTGFHPDFTGRENIRAALGYNNMSAEEIAAAEAEIIDFTELEDFIDQPVKNYSAGMYARLAFATATSIRPEILIIDEVLGAGDAYFAGKCVERMRSLSVESGATVLFVSHDLGSVQNMCDRCIWIDRGKLRMDGPSLDVIKAYSAQVREREEMRLKIRNEKKAIAGKSQDVDYSVRQFFQFSSKSGNTLDFCIKKIAFKYKNSPYAELYPGQPMDIDESQLASIVLGENNENWHSPERSGSDILRQCTVKTAMPALFSLIVQDMWKAADLDLEIEYTLSGSEGPLLSFFDRDAQSYRPIARLTAEQNLLKINCANDLSAVTVVDADKPEEELQVIEEVVAPEAAVEEPESEVEEVNLDAVQSNDIYGSGECEIRQVRFLTPDGETFMLPVQTAVDIELEIEVMQSVKNPVFVFAVYLPTGQTAMQIYHDSLQADMPVLDKGIKFMRFKIDRLLLGPGSYIASAAVFKQCPVNGMEPEAYCLWDRRIEFQVCSDLPEVITPGCYYQKSDIAVLTEK